MICNSELSVGMAGVLCPWEHRIPLGIHGTKDDESILWTGDVGGRFLFRMGSCTWGRNQILFLEHEIECGNLNLVIDGRPYREGHGRKGGKSESVDGRDV